MSRHIPKHQNSAETYRIAEQFKNEALIGGRSLFMPGKTLWVPENFEPLIRHYVEEPIPENDGEDEKNFWDKLRKQLSKCPAESVALCAEIYWILTLPSSKLKVDSKLKRIREIWGMASSPLPSIPDDSPYLQPTALEGVGNTGAAYNLLLWMELAYAIRVFKDLAEMPEAKRAELLSAPPLAGTDGAGDHAGAAKAGSLQPWAFAKWLDEAREAKGRQFYHILSHALFPDYFERIFAEQGKALLARHERLGIVPSQRAPRHVRDAALLDARQMIEREVGHDIDYYIDPPLLKKPPKVKLKAQGMGTSMPALTAESVVARLDEDDDEDGAGAPGRAWNPRNRIFFGPPGSGKTRALETIRKKRHAAGETVEFVSFHPSYSYEDFVEGYRPARGQGGRLGDTPVPGPFRRICQSAHEHPEVRHTLLIDEINRANVAKVFGELITILEPSKRCAPNPKLDFSGVRTAVRLQYSGDELAVPANLDIIGSMNTADRSVQSIDRALRRRFEFTETPADPRLLPAAKVGGVDLRALLAAINDRIEFLIDGDHALGHALLMGVGNLWDLRRAFARRVIPLLQEYFFEDLGKAKLALTGSSKPSAFFEERPLEPSKLFDQSADLDGLESRVSIRPSDNLTSWTAADFIRLYLRDDDAAAAIAALTPIDPSGEEGAEAESEDRDELAEEAAPGSRMPSGADEGGAGEGGPATPPLAGSEAEPAAANDPGAAPAAGAGA
jgi:5-methylcytosine-specific restriction protein B